MLKFEELGGVTWLQTGFRGSNVGILGKTTHGAERASISCCRKLPDLYGILYLYEIDLRLLWRTHRLLCPWKPSLRKPVP